MYRTIFATIGEVTLTLLRRQVMHDFALDGGNAMFSCSRAVGGGIVAGSGLLMIAKAVAV